MSFVRSVFAPAVRVSLSHFPPHSIRSPYPRDLMLWANTYTVTLLPWEQLSRTPRFISRTLATQAPFPTASTSTSTSTTEPLSEGVVGGGEGLGAQPVFPGGDVDVTDSVLKMLESEDGKFILLLSTHQQGIEAD